MAATGFADFLTGLPRRTSALAAALGIVRAHQGAIEVNSAPGQGSRFRVWFPLTNSPPPSAP